jgi:hypothetical protein
MDGQVKATGESGESFPGPAALSSVRWAKILIAFPKTAFWLRPVLSDCCWESDAYEGYFNQGHCISLGNSFSELGDRTRRNTSKATAALYGLCNEVEHFPAATQVKFLPRNPVP